MNRFKINIIRNYYFKINFKQISTYKNSNTNPDLIKNFTPKQIGKIAVDVSKCANADIKIWDSFKDSTINSINSFDYKDLLRIIEGFNKFYTHLNYEIRNKDTTFFKLIIDKLFELCDSYNCSQLSHIAHIVSNFNHCSLDFCKLFSKVAVLFKLRLAEAISNDIVKLLVSFSRVGIHDKSLTDTLVQLALRNNFTLDELRSISVSCSLLDHCDVNLLNRLCDMYNTSNGISINELAVLSFIFIKCSFTGDKVTSLFERNLNRINTLCFGDLDGLDIPNFCLNLHNIGVKVPESLINLVNFKCLSPNLLVEMLDLISLYPSKQDSVLIKCKEMERDADSNLKILRYISRGPFNKVSHQLFKLLLQDSSGLTSDYLTSLLEDASLLKLPVHWLLESQLFDMNPTNTEGVRMLMYIFSSLLSFLRLSSDYSLIAGGTNYFLPETKGVNCLINRIEDKLSGLCTNYPLLNILLDVVPLDANLPLILSRELERLLSKQIKVAAIYEGLNVNLVEGTKDVVFPIYPDDLVHIESDDTIDFYIPEMSNISVKIDPGFYGIPGFTLPRIPVLIKMYFISKLNYNLIPLCFYEWNKLTDDDKKIKYLLKYATHRHT